MKILLSISFVLMISGLPVSAFNIYIPADYTTIQEGIDAASPGDKVLVAAGTYFENIDFMGKDITVRGLLGAEATVIDGSQAGSVVTFNQLETPNARLVGFTLTNGRAELGGGIHCSDFSSPTINQNIITGNYAFSVSANSSHGDGGGISCLCSSAAIVCNIITGNHAENDGGGISCQNLSTPKIENNFINNNTARVGGGISTRICVPRIIGNTISENSCTPYEGGGLHIWNSTAVIENNRILDNSAHRWGGGIFYSHHHSATSSSIQKNIISGNHCDDWGGGMICFGDTGLIIADNIFSCNNADGSGGGLYCRDSKPIITNNTFYGNTTEYSGGGIFTYTALTVQIINCISWNNEANTDPELSYGYLTVEPDVSYCNIKGGWSGTGNIDAEPAFVDAANQDYHLLSSSPCRNAGTIWAVSGPEDFEGDPRFEDDFPDMGADEFYTHLYCMGEATPGGSIECKIIGIPGTWPVGLFLGSGVLAEPFHHMWGDFWLMEPWFVIPIVPIPADGVIVLPAILPGTPVAPWDLPMQALVGLDSEALSNLYVLEVR